MEPIKLIREEGKPDTYIVDGSYEFKVFTAKSLDTLAIHKATFDKLLKIEQDLVKAECLKQYENSNNK